MSYGLVFLLYSATGAEHDGKATASGHLAGMPALPLEALPGSEALLEEGDFSVLMVNGIGAYLDRDIECSRSNRMSFWRRDFSSKEAYEHSVKPNRERLRRIIGAGSDLAGLAPAPLVKGIKVAETDRVRIHEVRWSVLEGVHAEGLWLEPKQPPKAYVVLVGDADQTPEELAGLSPGLEPGRQCARRLAENGCEVLVPALVDRQDTWSGSEKLQRFTNQPHREWIYRQAYELGRHVIGYEVLKVLAGVECLQRKAETEISPKDAGNFKVPASVGVAGYQEGGLIALYAAAIEPSVDAALVSGYFNARERIWEEPIYRNVFGLLREFGDAEIATLIAPRPLVIEHSPVRPVAGPPPLREGRAGAAPGKLSTPDYESVEAEFNRARDLLGSDEMYSERLALITGTEGLPTGPMSDRALEAFLAGLGFKTPDLERSGRAPTDSRKGFGAGDRQRRQVQELDAYTQKVYTACAAERDDFFWQKATGTTLATWREASAPFRQELWETVIGRLPEPNVPVQARSRKFAEREKWAGHEVVLQVYPDVFAWGRLLVPNDARKGERLPVVVCQHGLEGLPEHVITEDMTNSAYGIYKGFAARLADAGYVVFAPHNPYRGGDRFRVLQRKANPLGKSLFSFIIAQHTRILEWLGTLPFVDAKRIGFYGLSYGGKTAMRVPAVLEGYALSICSGDFNEWIRKNVSLDFEASYMFTGEYEIPEWNLGRTFNYAEMAALIAPRPFMVERGRKDPVGLDEWVAEEYGKVKHFYEQLGIPERTEIEFFEGRHTINGVGTFRFLDRWLRFSSQPERGKNGG